MKIVLFSIKESQERGISFTKNIVHHEVLNK